MQPSDQLQTALNATIMLARSRVRLGGRGPTIGIAGPQGSGKTTLAKAYAAANPGVAAFSLDDVYLSSAQRRDLAGRVHPLFVTRGVPGTHDLKLLEDTICRLAMAPPQHRTAIPAFDKVRDDPAPRSQWPDFEGAPKVILVDGWCVGATPQSDEALDQPVNALEANEDKLGRWRAYVNEQLAGPYRNAWDLCDAILYLRPPSFDVVEGWRRQQEEGLLGRPLSDEDGPRIHRFVAHFERITRHMLAGGHRADVVVRLDEGREVLSVDRA